MRAVRQMGVDRNVRENKKFPEISKESVILGSFAGFEGSIVKNY